MAVTTVRQLVIYRKLSVGVTNFCFGHTGMVADCIGRKLLVRMFFQQICWFVE